MLAKLATGADSIGSLGLVMRACRIGRVLRLMQSAPGMRQLFDTLITTLPGLTNVGGLLLLICFIYAAVGVQLFALVSYSGAVGVHCNFRTFAGALFSLLRFATGEKEPPNHTQRCSIFDRFSSSVLRTP